MLRTLKYFLATACITSIAATALAANVSIPMYMTAASDVGKSVGAVTIIETKYGLLITPELHGLTPGVHGFHVHQNSDCSQNGMAAGGHFDPKNTAKHLGPYNDDGHLGDLPALYVNSDGTATVPVLAPRIMKIAEIKKHSLMVHEGGDTYSDSPASLGGGGARMECGVIM